jgi:Spy/CpxP family protein refolding chaperone
MRFAVALFALGFVAQSFLPAVAEETALPEIAATVPIVEGASANVIGGEGAARTRMQFTDQQKEKFYELKNKLLSEAGPKKLALAEQKRMLKDLLTQENIDRKAVMAAQDKINSLHTELANVAVAYKLDFQQELTPDQRKVMRYKSLRPGGGKGSAHHGRKMHHKGFPRANQTVGPDRIGSTESGGAQLSVDSDILDSGTITASSI